MTFLTLFPFAHAERGTSMRRLPSVVRVALALLVVPALPAARPLAAQEPGAGLHKAFPNDSVLRTRTLGRMVTIDHTAMGDVRTSELVVVPTVSSAPETGCGAGAGFVYSRLIGIHEHDQRPSTLQASLQLTQKEQYTVNTVGDIWTRHDRYRVTYEVAWSHFPKVFFGIGPVSPPDGEPWTPTYQRAAAAVWRRMAPNIYAGVQGLIEHEMVAVGDSLGALASTVVPGQLGWNRAQLLIDAVAGTPPFDRMPQLGGSAILRGLWDGRFREPGSDRHAGRTPLAGLAPAGLRDPCGTWLGRALAGGNRPGAVPFRRRGGAAVRPQGRRPVEYPDRPRPGPRHERDVLHARGSVPGGCEEYLITI